MFYYVFCHRHIIFLAGMTDMYDHVRISKVTDRFTKNMFLLSESNTTWDSS